MANFWDDLRFVLDHVGFDEPPQDNGGMPSRSDRLERAVADLKDTANSPALPGDPVLNLRPLRIANETRQAEWPGGEHVDLAFRGLELWGESGELGNKLKKLVRIQRGIKGTTEGLPDLMSDICDEIGDVLISLDLIAMELGIDLSLATRSKFNQTSEKHGLSTRL